MEIEWSAREIEALRQGVIPLRDKCLDLENFDSAGAVILSHALKALAEYRDALAYIEVQQGQGESDE